MRRELVSLLAACKRDPDDDAARLVLADWLEEHGDEADRERAAFVRLVATSGEEKGQPDFRYLRGQEWKRHQETWGPFQKSLHRSRPWYPVAGLVGAHATPAMMSAPRAARWAAREEWAWVDRLHVSPQVGRLAAVLDSPLMASVGTLYLEQGKLEEDSATFGRSAGLAALSGLWLRDCRWADLAPLALSPHASGLRPLCVWWQGLTEQTFDALALPGVLPALEDVALPAHDRRRFLAAVTGPWRRLRFLDVSHDLSPEDVRALGAADACSALERLRVQMFAGQLPLEALAGARFWTTIRKLQVECGLTESAASALATVEAPALRYLSLSGGASMPAALSRVAGGPLMAGLSYLYLGFSGAGPPVVAALTAAERAPLTLALSCCRVGDEGVARLARWPGMERCRVLNLAINDLTEAGARALAGSPYLGGLVGLDVSNNPLGDDGIEALMSAGWLGGLEQLLVNNSGGGAGGSAALLRAAARMPRMKELSVGAEMSSDALREAFAHAGTVE